MNRFKELDLVDRMPEELWMEVLKLHKKGCPKPLPRKMNARRQSGCLGESYKLITEKRNVKGKGEKERHTQLNAEIKRRVRR